MSCSVFVYVAGESIAGLPQKLDRNAGPSGNHQSPASVVSLFHAAVILLDPSITRTRTTAPPNFSTDQLSHFAGQYLDHTLFWTTVDLATFLAPPRKRLRTRRPKPANDAPVGGGLGAADDPQ